MSRRDAAILFSCVAALGLAALLLPGVVWERRASIDAARLAPAGGLAWRYDVELATPADKRDKAKSYVSVLEDGRKLGPAHELPRIIEVVGHGAYRHERDHVLLSSSDATDPRSNGRRYELTWPGHLPFTLQYAVVALFAAFGLAVVSFAASRATRGPRARRWLEAAGIAAVAAVALESLAKAITQQIFLDDDGQFARAIYQQAFGTGGGDDAHGPFAPMFGPHAYLPYVLDPRRTDDGRREINEEFLIRRSEPIRPRGEVALRILAVGGSTTHDLKIHAEDFTWVHQLESALRGRHGAAVDVINGGVGGYTIYENFIHYITLLTHLDPDVVLFFQSINDVHPRIFHNEHYDYRDYNRPWWDPRQVEIERSRNPIAATWTGRLLLWLTHYQHVSQLDIGFLTRQPYPQPDAWAENLRQTPPDLYRQMLENFVLLVKAQGRRPVIVPQLWRSRNESDEVFAKGLAENNRVSLEVAERYGVPFVPLARLDAAFSDDDFVDNCHFGPTGAEKMAAQLAAFLEESGVVSQVLAAREAPAAARR